MASFGQILVSIRNIKSPAIDDTEIAYPIIYALPVHSLPCPAKVCLHCTRHTGRFCLSFCPDLWSEGNVFKATLARLFSSTSFSTGSSSIQLSYLSRTMSTDFGNATINCMHTYGNSDVTGIGVRPQMLKLIFRCAFLRTSP